MPEPTVEQLLQAVFAVELGLATPAEVADAAAKLGEAQAGDLVDQLVNEGFIRPEHRDNIGRRVAKTLFAGRDTLDLEPVVEQGIGRVADATFDVASQSVAAAAAKFGSGEFAKADLPIDEQVSLPRPGRYTIRKLHSRGGQARILLARDEYIGREVAIKELTFDGPDDSQDSEELTSRRRANKIRRFLREARITAQLDHPNITPVHELGRLEDGSLYYTMRFVHGQTLSERLRACSDLSDRLRLLGVFWDLVNAISFAHDRGVIHRDIKPDNVMTGPFGQTVLLDWGIAKIRGQTDERARDLERRVELLQADADETMAGFAIGTPSTMSPEQARGQVNLIDERSDVWGLGVVLYQILAGRAPFEGLSSREVLEKVVKHPHPPVRSICAEAPAELCAVVEKALQKNPAQRYQSAQELADDLGAYMTGAKVQAYDYTSWELLRRFTAKHKTGVVIAVSSLALLIASLVLVLGAYRQAAAARDSARAERQIANYHLAQGYAEKAERLIEQARYPAARVFAAASLVHNPANPSGPFSESGFEAKHPASHDLLVTAASGIYRSRHSLQVEPRAVMATTGTPHSVTFSPEGRLLAAAGLNGSLAVWDSTQPEEARTRTICDGRAYSIVFTPDGSEIIATGADGVVKAWALPDLSGPRTFVGHTDAVMSVAVSPDGAFLATGGADDTVRLWDLESGENLDVLRGHTARVWTLAFSPDGTRLASGSWDKTVRLWDIPSGKHLRTYSGHTDAIYGLAFGPKGARLASASWDRTVRIWDPRNGRDIHALTEGKDAQLSVAWSSNGKFLAAGGADRAFRLWDPENGELLLALDAHKDMVTSVAFTPDSRFLATVGFDRRARLWALDEAERIPRLRGHRDWIYGVRYGPDGTRLATAAWDKSAAIWDTVGRQRIHELKGHRNGLYPVAYSPDGKQVASAGSKGELRLWDAKSGRMNHTLAAHDKWIYELIFTPDAGRLLSASRDGSLKVWDAHSGKLLNRFDTPGNSLYGAALSPDGKRLATCGTDRIVRLYDLSSGKAERELKGHTDWVSGLAFSPDGKLLASAGRDTQIILWDPKSGAELKRLEGHDQWINAVRFSPDGVFLASSSDDSSVVVWNLKRYLPVLRLRFGSGVADIDFSPDSKTLAVGAGFDVALFPLDLQALESDPSLLLNDAEAAIGMTLMGFDLERPNP